MPTQTVIVIGASAGGIAPVRAFLGKFPKSIPAAMFVVVHTPPDGPGRLAMVIRNGCVYVAPPYYHLVIDSRRFRLTRGPRAMVQGPDEAEVPAMPLNAMRRGRQAHG